MQELLLAFILFWVIIRLSRQGLFIVRRGILQQYVPEFLAYFELPATTEVFVDPKAGWISTTGGHYGTACGFSRAKWVPWKAL